MFQGIARAVQGVLGAFQEVSRGFRGIPGNSSVFQVRSGVVLLISRALQGFLSAFKGFPGIFGGRGSS